MVRVTDVSAVNVEISNELGCIALFFDEMISAQMRPILSTCMFEGSKKGDKND